MRGAGGATCYRTMLHSTGELEKLLRINPSPRAEEEKFVEITCQVGFEPHGRASEDWEVFWVLTLPQVARHWKSTSGWRKGAAGWPMSFKGRTLEDVLLQAIAFLQESGLTAQGQHYEGPGQIEGDLS